MHAWQLHVSAAAVGATWAASRFDWNSAAGRSAFEFIEGAIPDWQVDLVDS